MSSSKPVYKGKVLADDKGGSLALVAQRWPNVNEVKDNAKENNRRSRIRICAQKVCDHMIRHPSSSVEIWTSVESGHICSEGDDTPSKKGHVSSALEGDEKYTSIMKIPLGKKSKILCFVCDMFTPSLADKIHDQDQYAIEEIFNLVFCTHKKDKVPNNASTDAIIMNMMRLRLKEVGFDFASWLKVCVGEDGWSCLLG